MKTLPLEIKRKYHDAEWRKIAGLRDIMIHEYFGINLKIIWDVAINKLPQLKATIAKMIGELSN